MPQAGRIAAAVVGRPAHTRVSVQCVRGADRNPPGPQPADTVDRPGRRQGYQLAAARAADYRRRDGLLATQAAAILLIQLAAWLVVAYVGFALLLWPFAARGVVSAFTDAGSSLFTLGFAVPAGAVSAAVQDAARRRSSW
jgi:hypothetical protein